MAYHTLDTAWDAETKGLIAKLRVHRQHTSV